MFLRKSCLTRELETKIPKLSPLLKMKMYIYDFTQFIVVRCSNIIIISLLQQFSLNI